MEIGITKKSTITVTKDMVAKKIGSGGLDVFATPAMIAFIEKTAAESVSQYLENGYSTVGTLVNIKHLSATPIGMDVTFETKLIEIDRKRLVFDVKAYDKAGCIGEGIHERFIINNSKFMEKVENKLNN